MTKVEEPEQIKTIITTIPRRSQPTKLFDPARAYDDMVAITQKKLAKKVYDSEDASKLCKDIADDVRMRVRSTTDVRYKICVQASIFS